MESCRLCFFMSGFLKNFFIFLIYFWPCWVFITVRGLSLVAVSGGYSSLQCTGFSLRWLLLLWSTGCRHKGFSICGVRASVVVAHGLSCSAACGIFPGQGSNPRCLQCQADSSPLRHQGSLVICVFKELLWLLCGEWVAEESRWYVLSYLLGFYSILRLKKHLPSSWQPPFYFLPLWIWLV